VTAVLRILSAGPGATLQDAGRTGFLRFGVTEAGPMDQLAFATANLAAGAEPGTAAIEIGTGGMDLAVADAVVTVGVAGGGFLVTLDGGSMPEAARLRLEPGQRLSIAPGAHGGWCYLAVPGGFDLAPALGSLSTHSRSGLGGLHGRMLAGGDLLPLRQPFLAGDPATGELLAPWLDRPGKTVRVMLGPQDDYFDAAAIETFLGTDWTLSARSDRMAYMLEGPTLSHSKGFNIVSDGIAIGAVQVPGDGRPLVLMADRQPTGGYPKIATVIGPDLARLANLRPGEAFRFAAVSWDEAVAVRRTEAEALADPPVFEPLVRTDFSAEFLLAQNLADGVAA
jgi:biotin-dependent carboxylase-like uncharacterized protein